MSDLKVLIVTKSDTRHRLFLKKALKDIVNCHISIIIQDSNKDKQVKHLYKLYQTSRTLIGKILRKCKLISPLDGTIFDHKLHYDQDRSSDSYLLDMLNISPISNAEMSDLKIVSDINSEESIQALQNYSPDLIIVYGSKLLKGAWLKIAKFGVLNFHYGFLPFYRSGNSTKFACLLEDYNNIGGTIHYIDKGVDTGPIVSQFKVDPRGFKTINELTAAVYKKGIRHLIECVNNISKTRQKPRAKRKYASNSYFPSRYGTKYLDFAAQFRLSNIKKEWPYSQTKLEKSEHNILSPSLIKRIERRLRKKNSLEFPNGVYILLYHGIYDSQNPLEWERAYHKVMTSKQNLKMHLDFLRENRFEPIKLSEAPEILRRTAADKKYVAITFDDGYINLLDNALPLLKKYKFNPTVFVNGSFISGPPYFRLLATLLKQKGDTQNLKNILKKNIPKVQWSNESDELFNQLKNLYVPDLIEKSIQTAYDQSFGNLEKLNFHLSIEDIKHLTKQGWEIGNHTWEHQTLSSLDRDKVYEGINKNSIFLKENCIKTIPWLSYPNGRAKDVNLAVKSWLDENPEYYGIFAGGGINLIHTRTEWFRVSIGDENINSFKDKIRRNINSTFNLYENEINTKILA